jgi:hypothetical protein
MKQRMAYGNHSLPVVILFFFLMSQILVADVTGKDQLMKFKWAFIRLDIEGRIETLDFRDRVTAYSGDQIKIFLQPIGNVYLYLFFYSSQKELSLLFPASLEDFDYSFQDGEGYYIPSNDRWFVLDKNKGIETFYLLASATRLKTLEEATIVFLNAPEKKREMLKLKLLTEIKGIRKRHSELKVRAEKPQSIAGTVRGVDKGMEHYVFEVESEGFYGKTFRIDHQ